jgi:anti-sigma factor RsiW
VTVTDDRDMSTLEWVRARREKREQEQERRAEERDKARYSASQNKRDEANVKAGYRARLEEDRKRRERTDKKPAAKKPPAKKPASSKRRPAGRRSGTRRMVRQVTQPARAQVFSGMRVVGMTLAVSALYLVLTTEEQRPTISPALNGFAGALRWLAAPDRSIPYAR